MLANEMASERNGCPRDFSAWSNYRQLCQYDCQDRVALTTHLRQCSFCESFQLHNMLDAALNIREHKSRLKAVCRTTGRPPDLILTTSFGSELLPLDFHSTPERSTRKLKRTREKQTKRKIRKNNGIQIENQCQSSSIMMDICPVPPFITPSFCQGLCANPTYLNTVSILSAFANPCSRASGRGTFACPLPSVKLIMIMYKGRLQINYHSSWMEVWYSVMNNVNLLPRKLIGWVQNVGKLFTGVYQPRSHYTTADSLIQTWYIIKTAYSTRFLFRLEARLTVFTLYDQPMQEERKMKDSRDTTFNKSSNQCSKSTASQGP